MYLFDLGRDQEISMAEVFAKLSSMKISYDFFDEGDSFIVLKCDLDPEKIMKALGGTVRIVKVYEFDFLPEPDGRWGFSALGVSKSEYEAKLSVLKKQFSGRMFKRSSNRRNRTGLSPIDLPRFKTEFFYAKGKMEYWGVTQAYFKVESQIRRDVKRPGRDSSQAVSIRIAKIMVNLSMCCEGDNLLDPFCGVGTVLQEALLSGCNVVGVDLNESMITKCTDNLRWLKKRFPFNGSFRVVKGDSRKVSRFIHERFTSIVSEPYMGPLIKKSFSRSQAASSVRNLEFFYAAFFKEPSKLLKPGGRIVFVFPKYVFGKNVYEVNMGFALKGLPLSLVNSFEYAKENNLLSRTIVVLEKIV